MHALDTQLTKRRPRHFAGWWKNLVERAIADRPDPWVRVLRAREPRS